MNGALVGGTARWLCPTLSLPLAIVWRWTTRDWRRVLDGDGWKHMLRVARQPSQNFKWRTAVPAASSNAVGENMLVR
jgi:hypothetical protein